MSASDQSAPASGAPVLFDRALVRARRDRAAGAFLDHDFLHARVADDLLDRVESVSRDFDACLAVGGGGAVGRALMKRPEARAKTGTLIEADFSGKMARLGQQAPVCLDEERLPVAPQSLDLVLACASLHWTNDLVGALIQINLALKPDGFFAGALFGGGTLGELRQCLLRAESELTGGAHARVSPFADAIDMAGLLTRAGFAMAVSDVDRVKVRYDDAFALMRDLRAMGETNALADRARKPGVKALLTRTAALYAEAFGEPDGRIPVSFDIIHFAGWAPHPDQPRPKRPGSANVRLADALGVRETGTGEKAGR